MSLSQLLFDRRYRDFTCLFAAQLISQFGDRMHQLALVVFIAERSPGSAMNLAKLIAFTILPVFIIQPFAGVLVDRWDRRTTLFVCDLMRGLLVLLIPLYLIHFDSMIPIYCIVFLVFCFSRFYIPAKMSIVPDLVRPEHIIQANSLLTTTGMVAFVLGASIGSFYMEKYGACNGFLVDAGTFFISAIFLISIDLKKHLSTSKVTMARTKDVIQKVKMTFRQEMTEGFRYLIDHQELRFVIQTLFVLMTAAGSIYVVIIVFIQHSFNSYVIDLGLLAISLGAGLFCGVIAFGKFGKNISWPVTIFSCLIGGGIMLILFSFLVRFTAQIYLSMAITFVWGMVIGPIFIASNSIAHLVSDEHMRGKVFSALEMVIHFAFLVSMFASSWLAEQIDEFWILIGVGVMITVYGLFGLVSGKKIGIVDSEQRT